MLNPVYLSFGLYLDRHSVMVSFAGLFFGPVAVLISAIMTMMLRIYLGGTGTLVGVLVSASAAFWSILFYRMMHRLKHKISVFTPLAFWFISSFYDAIADVSVTGRARF